MKDFDSWNKEKKGLEDHGPDGLPFHEREIWWCSIGQNIGDEQDGKNELFERPVLVLKKFNSKICWALPMSTKKKNNKYYHPVTNDENSPSVILSQLRLVSVKRFRRFIQKITPHQFEIVRERVINLIRM